MDEPLLEADVLGVAEPPVGRRAGGLSERTLRTTWSQVRSSSAVTAPVTAVA